MATKRKLGMRSSSARADAGSAPPAPNPKQGACRPASSRLGCAAGMAIAGRFRFFESEVDVFHLGWFVGRGYSVHAWNQPWSGTIGSDWARGDLLIDLARAMDRAC